jgi:hypothetical protein
MKEKLLQLYWDFRIWLVKLVIGNHQVIANTHIMGNIIKPRFKGESPFLLDVSCYDVLFEAHQKISIYGEAQFLGASRVAVLFEQDHHSRSFASNAFTQAYPRIVNKPLGYAGLFNGDPKKGGKPTEEMSVLTVGQFLQMFNQKYKLEYGFEVTESGKKHEWIGKHKGKYIYAFIYDENGDNKVKINGNNTTMS